MKKRRIKRIAMLLLLVLSICAIPEVCQQAYANARPIRIRYTVRYRVKVKKKKIKPKLSDKKLTFTQGEIRSITLKNAKAKKVKWRSSNKKIATVKKDGKWCDIKAKKPGKVVITATYKGKKYKCKVTIKPKKAEAIYCYTNNNNETLQFKSEIAYDGTKTWSMYHSYVYGGGGCYLSDPSMGFDTPLFPVTIEFEVGDPSIMQCEWEDYDDDVGWILKLYPQKAGKTYLIISNSYNSQYMYFPIVVVDDYAP